MSIASFNADRQRGSLLEISAQMERLQEAITAAAVDAPSAIARPVITALNTTSSVMAQMQEEVSVAMTLVAQPYETAQVKRDKALALAQKAATTANAAIDALIAAAQKARQQLENQFMPQKPADAGDAMSAFRAQSLADAIWQQAEGRPEKVTLVLSDLLTNALAQNDDAGALTAWLIATQLNERYRAWGVTAMGMAAIRQAISQAVMHSRGKQSMPGLDLLKALSDSSIVRYTQSARYIVNDWAGSAQSSINNLFINSQIQNGLPLADDGMTLIRRDNGGVGLDTIVNAKRNGNAL